ncbi:hypothetical protein SAMN05216429_10951 [Marinobacter persicus]|uniref:Uncharacterized protein n=1 Tax=Marinobacter persicus TaxID=930118 RepID=A0A1I3W6L6_9GAMM|nr:hypothetical protein SAMN05216429_10951 [Marinobacter persicus]
MAAPYRMSQELHLPIETAVSLRTDREYFFNTMLATSITFPCTSVAEFRPSSNYLNVGIQYSCVGQYLLNVWLHKYEFITFGYNFFLKNLMRKLHPREGLNNRRFSPASV